MKNSPPDLAGLVNASGFMLQLGIENAVTTTSRRHEFEIEAREHPWQFNGQSGFVDLILGRGTVRLVCECKRSRDADWVFPVEEGRGLVDRARLHWTTFEEPNRLDGWFNFALTTESPESAFCMIRGHGENSMPLLERISSNLILSVEALAAEESSLRKTGETRDRRRVYVPVIVTTARLSVCRYDPDKIDLETGLANDPTFDEVPVVRFRKALSAPAKAVNEDPDEMPFRAFRRLSREQERTILVVNSGSFVNLLAAWKNGVVRNDSGRPREWN